MIKAIALIFVLAALVCMSFGCSYTEPSSKEAAEKHLKHDFDDLTYGAVVAGHGTAVCSFLPYMGSRIGRPG